MLSISNPLTAALVDYYVDYYSNKSEGIWVGEGAKKLRLGSLVTSEQFRDLILGFDPATGEKLVQNAGKAKRQGGWDLTYSAPKAVSVLWSQLSESKRKILETLQIEAVKDALQFLERNGAFTRRGKGGAILEKADLICALFNDYTSRELDPQLHSHVVLLNVGVRLDGTTGSIVSEGIFELKMAAGAIYRVSLASRLSEILQVEIENRSTGFHIKGVPEGLCDEMSKRRAAIKKVLAEIGKSDAISAKNAAMLTRPNSKEVNLEQLSDLWRAAGISFGFGKEQAESMFGKRIKVETEIPITFEIPEFRDSKEHNKPSATHDFRKQTEEAEKQAPANHASREQFMALLDLLTRQFFHIKYQSFTLPDMERWRKGDLFPTRKIKIPYIALGAKRQRWGFIKGIIFSTRHGELRLQQRIFFPGAPSLSPFRKLSLPALHWHRFTKSERKRGRSDAAFNSSWHLRFKSGQDFSQSKFSHQKTSENGQRQNSR